jgi:hypothetical protein
MNVTASKRRDLTQKDRKRHRQSDKNRLTTKTCSLLGVALENLLNAGRPGHF